MSPLPWARAGQTGMRQLTAMEGPVARTKQNASYGGPETGVLRGHTHSAWR